MKCVALGTGGMMPMPDRLTTSILVRHEGRMLLFDAGEGIQIALKRGGLGIKALDAVVVTHLHGDHVLGLPGVLMFRAQNQEPGPLTIIGPPGIGRFVRHNIDDLGYFMNYRIEFVEWSDAAGGLAWSWNGLRLIWEELDHSNLCLGYRLEESARPGRFDRERASELGVPMGPLFGQLQSGEAVTTPAGRNVRPEDVLGPSRRGRVVSYVTDTRPCSGARRLLSDADLAFVEGMFMAKHVEEAKEKRHMTAAEAGEVACASRVDRLVLVHVSPRYDSEDEEILEREAREYFPGAEVAETLKVYKVPLPDQASPGPEDHGSVGSPGVVGSSGHPRQEALSPGYEEEERE